MAPARARRHQVGACVCAWLRLAVAHRCKGASVPYLTHPRCARRTTSRRSSLTTAPRGWAQLTACFSARLSPTLSVRVSRPSRRRAWCARTHAHAPSPPRSQRSDAASQIEWCGEGQQRRLRLAIHLSPAPHAPERGTRVEVHWWWVWRGWRRVPGLAREAHAAAKAVAAAAEVSLAAALRRLRPELVCSPL